MGLVLFGLVGCFSLLSGCAWFQSPEAAYLKSAVHQATMEDVRHRLGLPRKTSTLTGGRTRWLYRIQEDHPSPAPRFHHTSAYLPLAVGALGKK